LTRGLHESQLALEEHGLALGMRTFAAHWRNMLKSSDFRAGLAQNRAAQ
jgi:hypothetical protein